MTESTTNQKAFTLEEILFAEPYRFDFFQAVRLLERIYAMRRPVGHAAEPSNEAVRFRTLTGLNFPASQIYALERENETNGKPMPPQMTVAFMGLTGPSGVLPHAYTELLMERLRNKDRAMVEFLDQFNHRVLSLFFRAWEKYRFPIGVERGLDDRFTEFLFDIIGLGTRGLRHRFSFADEGLLSYGGLIANKPHSASAMAGLLSDYFGVPTEIEQFKGQWLKLDPECASTLGRANHQLGISTIVGTRVWDQQSKLRVKFGPLSFERFVAFLPDGSGFKPAAELMQFFAGMEFDFDVQLVLQKEHVPFCKLSKNAKPALGWTTWLKTKPFRCDDEQVVLCAGHSS
ncbi:MAG TPA: type VI secretion system baseplate subunit TssG [Blastocatellia bacterium]|nr:type VI secretion system baseplate subunit TssG [Blastocatellia bacterium]